MKCSADDTYYPRDVCELYPCFFPAFLLLFTHTPTLSLDARSTKVAGECQYTALSSHLRGLTASLVTQRVAPRLRTTTTRRPPLSLSRARQNFFSFLFFLPLFLYTATAAGRNPFFFPFFETNVGDKSCVRRARFPVTQPYKQARTTRTSGRRSEASGAR